MKVINLLPKPRQEELHFETIFHSLLLMFNISLLSFAVVFLTQFGTKFYLEASSQSVAAEIGDLKTQVNKEESSGLKKQIQTDNDLVTDFNNLANATPKWYRIIKAFAPLPPAGINISSFVVDPVTMAVTINGLSPTRDLVIQLYNNILQDNKDFYNIDYPLENVAKPADIDFHFTFYIQDQLLK